MANRRYTHSNGKKIVVSWIQNKCRICKRFLSKKETKYCDRCRPIQDLFVRNKRCIKRYHNNPEVRKRHLDYVKIHYQENKEGYLLRSKIRRLGIGNFNIGDYI